MGVFSDQTLQTDFADVDLPMEGLVPHQDLPAAMPAPENHALVSANRVMIALAIMIGLWHAPTAWTQQPLPPPVIADSTRATPLPNGMPMPVTIPKLELSASNEAGEPPQLESLAPSELPPSLAWWDKMVASDVLDLPEWVTFDLPTVLIDTLRFSPRIQAVSSRTSVSLERIVQQDAVFDPSVLLESKYGRTNDPVGNALVTGGPPRLIEESFLARAGVRQTGRRGTEMNLSQELGLLDSNSQFFTPINQGNARLNLSLVQPLLDRGGRIYNERLLTQARIDGNISWQDMRGDVEKRIADVINAYWRLYELRCHMLQQQELLQRGRRIEKILVARDDFDSSRIEIAKARQRVARRVDRQVQIQAEIKKQQTSLAALVGSDQLAQANGRLEFIPLPTPPLPEFRIDLRDAVLQGIENRPEVRAATSELESAALSIRVTRAELLPELTAVVDTYLMGLNGSSDVLRSFGDQFSRGGPGVSAGLQYELPYGRRAARSRFRQANHRYRQKSEELRETIQLTHAEIETAIISIDTAMEQKRTKRRTLEAAVEEEKVLTRRWEMMGGDGAGVGTVLETLLDAQQRRTDAEREWTSARVRYRTSLVELQRAMGTLLTGEGIRPIKDRCDSTIHFLSPMDSATPSPLNSLTPSPMDSPVRMPDSAPTYQNQPLNMHPEMLPSGIAEPDVGPIDSAETEPSDIPLVEPDSPLPAGENQ